MARTDNLTNFLTDVADAIRQKKGDSSKILAKDFDTEISNLSGGGSTSTYAPRAISFYGCQEKDMTNEIQGWSSSNLTSMQYAFCGCTNVTNLDLSHIDTSKVTLMNDCFSGCNYLKTLNTKNWNTDLVKDVARMFRNCRVLENIDLSNGTFNNAKSWQFFLEGCMSLKTVNISAWDITKITNINGALSNVPTSCLFIVKDDACKTWFTSRFTDYKNVKTLAEYQG